MNPIRVVKFYPVEYTGCKQPIQHRVCTHFLLCQNPDGAATEKLIFKSS